MAFSGGTVDLWLGNVLDRRSCLGSNIDLPDDWDRPVPLTDDRGEGEGRGLINSIDSCLVNLRGVDTAFFGWCTSPSLSETPTSQFGTMYLTITKLTW